MTDLSRMNMTGAVVAFESPFSVNKIAGSESHEVNDAVSLSHEASSLINKKICIDPGHGGKDSGAVGPTGFNEKVANLEISKYLKQYLEGKGAKVVMTREKDMSLTTAGSGATELSARVKVANNSKADIFISIHNNSSNNAKANGTETYYYSKGSEASKLLSKIVFDKIVKKTGSSPRGSYPSSFYVIKYTNMPGMLSESAFVSNPSEEKKLKDPQFQKKVAEAIGEGMETYFSRLQSEHISTEKPVIPDDGKWDPLPCEKYVIKKV